MLKKLITESLQPDGVYLWYLKLWLDALAKIMIWQIYDRNRESWKGFVAIYHLKVRLLVSLCGSSKAWEEQNICNRLGWGIIIETLKDFNNNVKCTDISKLGKSCFLFPRNGNWKFTVYGENSGLRNGNWKFYSFRYINRKNFRFAKWKLEILQFPYQKLGKFPGYIT